MSETIDQTLARAGDGVAAVGPDGRIVMWNRSAERIMGYTACEAIGRTCCDVFVGRDDEDLRLCYQGCHVMTLVRMGEPVQSFDMQTRTRAGRSVWLNISILTLPDNSDPRRVLAVHLFRDVTTTKELLSLVQERFAAPDGATEGACALTRREQEILRLLAEGVSTRAAAERLGVSRATVRNHVQNILCKLGVHSRLEAVAYANQPRLRAGLNGHQADAGSPRAPRRPTVTANRTTVPSEVRDGARRPMRRDREGGL